MGKAVVSEAAPSEQPGHCPKTWSGQGSTERKNPKGIDPHMRCVQDLAMAGGSAPALHAGPATLESSPC